MSNIEAAMAPIAVPPVRVQPQVVVLRPTAGAEFRSALYELDTPSSPAEFKTRVARAGGESKRTTIRANGCEDPRATVESSESAGGFRHHIKVT